MSEEILQLTRLDVKIMSPEEFTNLAPPPERLQELVYSLYTLDGIPRSISPQLSSKLSQLYRQSDKKTAYVVTAGDLECLFQRPGTDHLKSIETELRNYKNLAGFFKVEWGMYKPGENLPLEAMLLTKNFPWTEDVTLGYAGSFTTNPLLPKQIRLEMLRDMLASAYILAATEGFSGQIYTILAPHVAKFVEASGAIAIPASETTELSDDPYAESVFKTFPGYWVTNPSLCRFVPNTHQ